jgi:hypothetical protein
VGKKLYTRLALGGAALAAALAACEDNPFIVGPYGVAGHWVGSGLAGSAADTVRFHFDLTLAQDRGALSGSGEIRGGTATIPVEVDGAWTAAGGEPNANVVLLMSSDGVAPLRFNGTFDVDSVARTLPETGFVLHTDTDTLVGTLTGSSLDNVHVVLGRAGD